MKHVAIIGGGITGLTAAFYLHQAIRKKGIQARISLLEADNRLGGKIRTKHQNGFVIEEGPDSFLARKTSAGQLVHDVGLDDELVRNRTGQAYVLNDDHLYPIPKKAVMGIPATLPGFVHNDLFSSRAKWRTAADLVMSRARWGDDPSAGNFFRRRFGSETVDRLIEPLLSGIYAGDLDKLSLMATFPQFYDVEQRARSLMLGLKKDREKVPEKEDKGKFLTLKNGLQSLSAEIEAQLPEDAVWKKASVDRLERNGQAYTITLGNGEQMQTDAVISAVPHHIAKNYLPSYPFTQSIGGARPTTVATVALAFPESAVKLGHDGTGFVISRTAGYTVTACTWTHKKWPHTTPQGKVLLRCYVGKAGDEGIVDQSDAAITDAVLRDLRRVLQIDGNPDFISVSRWRRAMPQYIVGHLQWLANLRREAARTLPGLFFAGASYEGVGVPDCIKQGKQAADEALQYII